MPEQLANSISMPSFPFNPRGLGERRLFIQVPCYNEAETLPITLAALPRRADGYAHVKWLVIDDGSTDGTHGVALRCGADYVLRLTHHRGLAYAFMAGLDAALQLGADTIVNTDGDNQYMRPAFQISSVRFSGSRQLSWLARARSRKSHTFRV